MDLHPITSVTWPITRREREAIRHVPPAVPKSFLRQTTIPNFIRSSAQRSTSSFVKVASSSGSAPNGDAKAQLREIFWQTIQSIYSPETKLGKIMASDPSGSLPLLVSPAFAFGLPQAAKIADFVPDIEIKSKRKKKLKTVWKHQRAVIDTACASGNWVTFKVVKDLGFKGKLLELTEAEKRKSLCATGAEFHARAAVMLTWRAIPGGGLPSYAKTFTMRFQVSSVEEPPYDILIGAQSICEYGIMYAPCLVMTPANRTHTLLPPETIPQGASDYRERRKIRAQHFEQVEAQRNALKKADVEAHQGPRAQGNAPQQPPTPLASRTSSIASDLKSQNPNNLNGIKQIGTSNVQSAGKK